MKIFGQLVRTVVTAIVPVAAVVDIVTMGGVYTGQNDGYDGPFELRKTYTGRAIQKLKDDAEEK